MSGINQHLSAALNMVQTAHTKITMETNASANNNSSNQTSRPIVLPDGTVVQDPSDVHLYNLRNGWNAPTPLFEDNSYTIVTRSFAPPSTFGGGFEGNNRGYSTDIDASSKVTQLVDIDLDEQNPIQDFDEYSDTTRHQLIPGRIYERTEIPDGGIVHQNVRQEGDKTILQFGTEIDAENPFTAGPGGNPNPAPSIDVFTEYEITQDKTNNTLHIKGAITGDNFPATEALIYDANGNPLFLGVGAPNELASPLVTLIGENDRPITDFDITVNTDANGNFESIEANGQTIPIDQWNENFTRQDPSFTDPITGYVDGAIEESREAAGEIKDETLEAITEIREAEGVRDTVGEVVEGGAEIGGEILEGGAEVGKTFVEDSIKTAGATAGEVIDRVTPWEGNIPDLNPFND